MELAKCEVVAKEETFFITDLMDNHLVGHSNSKFIREKLGEKLGIGYSNGKQLLSKLNNYGISREEFEKAMEEIFQEIK